VSSGAAAIPGDSLGSPTMPFPFAARNSWTAGCVGRRRERFRRLPFQQTNGLIQELAFQAKLNDELINVHGYLCSLRQFGQEYASLNWWDHEYYRSMRTRLELDDELLNAARRLAKERGVSLGQVISDLAWQSLTAIAPPKFRNGVEIFVTKPGDPIIDMEIVNRLRDEE
jgi:hypothetical protein